VPGNNRFIVVCLVLFFKNVTKSRSNGTEIDLQLLTVKHNHPFFW